MGKKAHSCAYSAALYAYLTSERGRDTAPLIRRRLELLPRTPLELDGATEQLVHELRLRLELTELRRSSAAATVLLRSCRSGFVFVDLRAAL
jgi:hypothetical protein